jgi:hypothetical protein
MADDDPVPKLPRGRGIRLAGPEMFRILITIAMLVAVLVLTKPCSQAVSKFVSDFDKPGKGSAAVREPGTIELPSGSAGSAAGSDQYEALRPDMTEAELKAAIDRARARAGVGSDAPRAVIPADAR